MGRSGLAPVLLRRRQAKVCGVRGQIARLRPPCRIGNGGFFTDGPEKTMATTAICISGSVAIIVEATSSLNGVQSSS
jgi:hypothetical protein